MFFTEQKKYLNRLQNLPVMLIPISREEKQKRKRLLVSEDNILQPKKDT